MKQYFTWQYWKGQRLLLLTFLFAHVVVASIHTSYQDVTSDEPDYYAYASHWLHGEVERTNPLYDSKTPIVAVALVPRIIKQILNPTYSATDFGRSDVLNGRYCMVVFTIIIALYLFTWARKLFGGNVWIFPVLFFLFEPTVISFSMLITSDMATGTCLIATMYHLWRFFTTQSWKQFLLFSFWLGVCIVCKASLLFFIPFLGLLYVLLLLFKVVKFNLKRFFLYAAVTFTISLVIINIAYFGKNSFHSLGSIHFESNTFKVLAEKPLLNKIPFPVPATYIQSLDLLKYHEEIGGGESQSTYPGVYINGQSKSHGGFWYYYLFTGFYKIPISILVLLSLGVVIVGTRRKFGALLLKYIWIIFPFVFFFMVLSFFNPFQIGFRHFLLIYPFIFLSISGLIYYFNQQSEYTTLFVILLFILMLCSTAAYFPNLIPYTNELLADKKNSFKKIGDASIDYGQNIRDKAAYLKRHPDILQAGDAPKPGKYIVRASEVQTKKWLLHFDAIAHYKYSMFIFYISQQDIANTQQKSRP